MLLAWTPEAGTVKWIQFMEILQRDCVRWDGLGDISRGEQAALPRGFWLRAQRLPHGLAGVRCTVNVRAERRDEVMNVSFHPPRTRSGFLNISLAKAACGVDATVAGLLFNLLRCGQMSVSVVMNRRHSTRPQNLPHLLS